ncbi:type IV toxin-antitoxin system AbiEi family antitoxin [Candidatus Bipolaricaulota bacterium]|nr:type IV toxin-antitoxin system AbiEi family antitoxin [Candidatus Bipolaricaulota bacterium]
MKKRARSLNSWVNEIQRVGRYTFTREEAIRELSLHTNTLEKSLQRATSQGRILRLRRGFYVIVPLEYAVVGAVPTEWFIDDLMKFIGKSYYVGCLSAAAWYGASHQRVQEMQVVVPEHVRGIESRAVRIRFLRFAGMSEALTTSRRTHTGDIPVSTAEWTAIDLIRFQKHYGSMDAAATVLIELAEGLNADDLTAAAGRERTNAYLQRLGWLLEFLGQDRLTRSLHSIVINRNPSYTPLNASLSNRSGRRDLRWRILVNEEPEADL